MNLRVKSKIAFTISILASVPVPVLAGEWMYPPGYHATTSTTTTTTPPNSTDTSIAPTIHPPKRRRAANVDPPQTDPAQAAAPSSSGNAVVPALPASPIAQPVVTTTSTTTSTTTNTAKQDARLKPFLAAVRTNFTSWDRNHDGNLDRQEMEIAAQDFRYTNDAAVALAVLKNSADVVFRSKNELTLIKLADMDAIETKIGSGLAIDPDYGRDFERLSSKLKAEPRQLFTGALPHLTAVHQATTLDCYFLSSVGGLVETNPRAIVDMIRPNPDGTYIVTFPNKAPIVVPPPTETELADYTDAMDGFWLNILEKAYGRTRTLNPKDYTAEPLDTAALFRGDCAEVMRILSGRKVKRIDFHVTGANAPTDEAVMSSVRAALSDAFASHQMITASKIHHAYTITEYDTTKDTVVAHNPYGLTGHERWADGSRGPKMEHGYFTCSLPDFVKNFRCMWFVR